MKRISINVILLITVMAILLIFLTTCKNPTIKKPDDTQLKIAEKQVIVIDKKYEEKNIALQKLNDSLQQVILQSAEKLKIAKFKLSLSQQTVLQLAQKDNVGKTTDEQLADYDSLKMKTIAYVAFVDSTLAVCEENISQLKDQVELKDRQLVNCDSSYSHMKTLAAQGLERERKLTEDLQKAYKQEKRRKVKNKLVAGVLVLLSGISAAVFIK